LIKNVLRKNFNRCLKAKPRIVEDGSSLVVESPPISLAEVALEAIDRTPEKSHLIAFNKGFKYKNYRKRHIVGSSV